MKRNMMILMLKGIFFVAVASLVFTSCGMIDNAAEDTARGILAADQVEPFNAALAESGEVSEAAKAVMSPEQFEAFQAAMVAKMEEITSKNNAVADSVVDASPVPGPLSMPLKDMIHYFLYAAVSGYFIRKGYIKVKASPPGKIVG